LYEISEESTKFFILKVDFPPIDLFAHDIELRSGRFQHTGKNL